MQCLQIESSEERKKTKSPSETDEIHAHIHFIHGIPFSFLNLCKFPFICVKMILLLFLLFETHHQAARQAHFPSAYVCEFFFAVHMKFVQHLFAIVERCLKCENWIRTQQKPLSRTKMHARCSQMNMLSHLNKSSACATREKGSASPIFNTTTSWRLSYSYKEWICSDQTRQKPFRKREQENEPSSSNLKIYRIRYSRAYTHIFHIY